MWPVFWGKKVIRFLLYAWGDVVRFAVFYDEMLWSTLSLRGECEARFMGRECDPLLLCAWGDVVRFAVSTRRECDPLCCVHRWFGLLFP